ncbi:LD-carboxypeptidase [Balneolales bacterium ANBcel1]|nr:LD-carboxypeptidase [Balneolales bacterium ANBcel1]
MKLRPLPDNGVIGIIAPSSPVDESRLERGVTYFEQLGYRTHVTASCYKREHYLAGDAQTRAAELMELIRNPSIDAVFFARGGFGSAAMLPLLDYDTIRASRKLLAGFSDITALQWGIYAQCGYPTVSAGMPATDFGKLSIDPFFEEQFWKFMKTGRVSCRVETAVLQGYADGPGESADPAYTAGKGAQNPSQIIEAGEKERYDASHTNSPHIRKITGTLLPGTLSVASNLAGTPWFPSVKGSILLLEDVGESRHKIEGNLLQAKLGGWFDQCRAVLFGDFAPAEKETFPENPSIDQILKRTVGETGVPYASGMPYGHIDRKIPFPVGQEISLSLGRSVEISSTDSLFDF